MKSDFTYDNLTGRPSGPFVRLGARIFPGVRKVQDQIAPYAAAWQAHNARNLAGDGPVWAVLGDSMSQGVGATAHDRGWVGQLDERLRAAGREYRIINLSASGARIRDVLEVQLPLLHALEIDPELVTVMIGSNDLVRKKYRRNVLSDFDELVEQVPEGSVIANLIGGRGEPAIMDVRLQRAVSERNLRLADIRRHGPRSWRGKVAEDRFHPNDAGYAVLADVFARALGL